MVSSILVTVAISTYNVADYIDDALKCIEGQTYDNIEILCIDDGSTDNTQAIIKMHADKDARYRIICHNQNYGLSVSRNRAIWESRGEYIIMLDGDDLFDKRMIEKAVNAVISACADMVLWDYAVFSNLKDLKDNIMGPSLLSGISSKDKIARLRRPAFMWVKLIKTSVLRELNIQFTPGLTKQDIPVHWQLVTSLDSIVILPEKLSFYRLQPNATSCRKDKSVFSLAYVMDITEKYLKSNGIYETYRSEFLRSRLSLLQGMYDFINPELKKDAMLMISERYDSEAQAYFAENKKELTPRTRYFFGSLSGNYFDAFKYNAVIATRNIYRSLKNFIGR